MTKPLEAARPDEGTLLLADLGSTLMSQFGVRAPTSSTLRNHAYDSRFPYLRLPSGKLAVRREDLPAIAALYATTETSAAA